MNRLQDTPSPATPLPGPVPAGPTAGAPPLTGAYILRWFSPRWFIFVMGTGALANVFELLSGGGGPLHLLAALFLAVAFAGFVASALFLALRAWLAPENILKEWRHSSLIQFYAAISIAAAVLCSGFLNIPLAFLPAPLALMAARLLWMAALAVGLALALFVPYKVTVGSHADPRRALAFAFLPPVGLFVFVFAGNFLAMRLPPEAILPSAAGILRLNVVVLGAASALTLIFYGIVLFRLLYHNFPRRDVAPSFMIGVAPAGVSIVAFNTLLPLLGKCGVTAVDPALVAGIVKLGSLMIFGFGLWWLLYATVIVIHYFATEGVPVTLGYWAFIFPPAAFTLASLLLARSIGEPLFATFAAGLASLVGLFWGVNLLLTLRGMADRTIFDVAPTFKGDIPYL